MHKLIDIKIVKNLFQHEAVKYIIFYKWSLIEDLIDIGTIMVVFQMTRWLTVGVVVEVVVNHCFTSFFGTKGFF